MSDKKRHFYEFLPINNILCGTGIGDRDRLLQAMLEMMKRHHQNLDLEQAVAEVSARETVFPTVIAPGLAVPHARINGLPQPLVALACVPEGVDFRSEMGAAKVVILLLTPVDDPNLHLQILAELGERFGDPELVNRLAEKKTPLEVMEELAGSHSAAMPDYLKAADVMSRPAATLQESDSLAHAIRTFATSRADELVVLDRSGDLRGILGLSDLLKFCLPEHLLWMENLSPIYLFQPFSDMLKSSSDTKVGDVMREEFITVESSVPAIQLAKLFLTHKQRQLVITENKRFAGIVDIQAFCAQLFWD